MDGRPEGAPPSTGWQTGPGSSAPPPAPGLPVAPLGAPLPVATLSAPPPAGAPPPAPGAQPSVSIAAPGAQPPLSIAAPGAQPPVPGDDGGHRGIALLLAATAIAAAIVAAGSANLASQAGDAWQSAVRLDSKRAAAAVADIQLVYQAEVPQAVAVLGARLQESRLREAAAAATGPLAAALATEADAQKGVAEAIRASVPLATDERYRLPDGALDLSTRLADLRKETPDLVTIDPEAVLAEGDALAAQASSMTFALWPFAFAALFGALAEPFGRQRRLLLALGTASFGIGVLVALATGVMG